MRGKVALFTLLLACGAARAQFPSDAALQQQIDQINVQRQSMFNLDVIKRPPPSKAPDIPTVVLKQQRLDIGQLVEEAQAAVKPGKPQTLLVFVSFSMPEESLLRLAKQTQQAGGVLLLRGFKDGSLKATVQEIQRLGLAGLPIQINPKGFSQYQIETVPSVILTREDAARQLDGQGCALPNAYAGVSGDVSLGYALERIAREHPDFAWQAERYRQALGGA